MFKTISWISILIASSLAGPAQPTKNQVAPKPEVRKVAEDQSAIQVSTSLISNKSKLEVTKKGDHKTFDLKIPRGFKLTYTEQAENGRYLIFVYEYEVFDGGNAQLLLIDKKHLSLVLQKKLDTFNISRPLIDGDTFFVGAAGFVGEYRLSDGGTVWEYSNLIGRPYYFDGVLEGQSIEILGDLVHFGPNFIVNRRTQKIVVKGLEK